MNRIKSLGLVSSALSCVAVACTWSFARASSDDASQFPYRLRALNMLTYGPHNKLIVLQTETLGDIWLQ